MSESKTRGAHSGFMKNGYCHTDSNASCARILLLRNRGVEETHDEATLARFKVGTDNEDYFCRTFLSGLQYQTDVPLSRGDFMGHADVVTHDTVYELKSVTSERVWKAVLDGKYKLSNLAQLVGYLWASGLQDGVLAYTMYRETALKLIPVFTKQFSVKLADTGAIIVDGVQVEYTLQEWHSHQTYLISDLNGTHLQPDMPLNPNDAFFTPCTYCWVNSVCDKFNAFTQPTDEFVEACKNQLKSG